MTQSIAGHRRYTVRLLEAELSRRAQAHAGPGSVDELRTLHRLVLSEAARMQRLSDYDPYRHPAAQIIEGWPPEHPLTVAVQALVDYAWRPIEFAPGGRFTFPHPAEPAPHQD